MQKSLDTTKKAYHTPDLKVYGSFNELTLATGGATGMDNTTGTYGTVGTVVVS